MTHIELLGGELVGAALHFRWDVERDDGEHMHAVVVVPTPQSAIAAVKTMWRDDGTGDDVLDAELVRRTSRILTFAAVTDLTREWLSGNGLSSQRDGRRLAAVA